jgi:hypothetical protein
MSWARARRFRRFGQEGQRRPETASDQDGSLPVLVFVNQLLKARRVEEIRRARRVFEAMTR